MKTDIKDYVAENHIRSLMKAISWRILGSIATFFITFSLTHNLNVATIAGIIEFVLKILLFYAHERVWIKINRFWFLKIERK